MTISANKKIDTGFAIALFIFLVISIVAQRNMFSLVKTSEAIETSHQVIVKLKETLVQVKDAESHARGYIINPQDSFLEAYKTSQLLIMQKLRDLRRWTKENKRQQIMLDDLETAISQKIGLINKTIELRRSSGLSAASDHLLVSSHEEKTRTIDDIMDRMEYEENELLRHKSQQGIANSQQAIAIIVFVSILGFLPVVIASFVIDKDMAGRRRLELEIKRLSDELAHQGAQIKLTRSGSER